jgi:hypothetical protein
MAGVGLSVPSGGSGSGGGLVPGGGASVSSSSWDGWSLCTVVWVGLSMLMGSERSRVRHVHASSVVGQETACGARRWTLQ